ncbi:hypothetical protein [Streptomyces sp. NRRL S-350]|uniref:hypothetical protein n=1 Tax=Streptomyces sp. NRRL S-350 TaxID=1463902 RepID=UPI0004C13094|nr:hypothetical protein [Streptomyces sp. NRRL S-350]
MAGLHLAYLAMDQLAGLATLLTTASPSVTAPSVMARSVLETASQAYYLLDPAADALERIRRQQNYRLVALWESRRLLDPGQSRDPAASPTAVRKADEKIEVILRTAPKFGQSPRRSKGNRSVPFIASTEHTKAVRAMPLIEDVVGGNGGLGSLVYRLGSAVTHGQQHRITQFFEHMGSLLDHTHGDAFGRLEASAKKTSLYLGAAPVAVMRMLSRLYERFGWPTQELVAANRNVAQVWGRIAEVPLNTGQSVGAAFQPETRAETQ